MPKFEAASARRTGAASRVLRFEVREIDDAEPGQYGNQNRWSFHVSAPETPDESIRGSDGERVPLLPMGVDQDDPESRSRPWVEALYGRPLVNGERPQEALLIGRRMRALVVHVTDGNGKTRARISGEVAPKPFPRRGESSVDPVPEPAAPEPVDAVRRHVVARSSATTKRNSLAPGPSKRPTSGSGSSGAHTSQLTLSMRVRRHPQTWSAPASCLRTVTMTSLNRYYEPRRMPSSRPPVGGRSFRLCWPTDDGCCGCGQGHEKRDVGKAPIGRLVPNGVKRRDDRPRDDPVLVESSARTPTSASTWCAPASSWWTRTMRRPWPRRRRWGSRPPSHG